MEQAKLLLVEDHADTARVMHKLLARHGYHVTVAHTLAQAGELCQQQSFDLLIADLSLPDGDGTELLQAHACSDTPAIALTGRAMPDDVARAQKAGFRRHLAKPVALAELLSAVEQALSS